MIREAKARSRCVVSGRACGGGLHPGVGSRADGQRQLDQGQRVAGRLAEDPLGVRVAQAGGVPGQEVARACLVQPAQIQFGQARGGEGDVMALAHGADQHARIAAQPAGQEREHVLGRLVEPLHVVGDQKHRTLRSDVGQQVQRGERDHERLWRRPVTHAERGGKRPGLGGGQPVHGAQYRSQQVVQAGVWQVSLRLDAGGRQHPQACRPAVVCGGPQQRGFPDTRITEHDDRRAAVGDLIDEASEDP